MAKEISLMTLRRETSVKDEAYMVEQARHDADAFALLYRRYLQPVYRYLIQRIGDPAEAEDLTSQVFMEALEGLVHYRDRGKFPAWLFTIARRRLIDSYRKRRPDVSIDQPNSDPDQEDEIEKELHLAGEHDLLDQMEQAETLSRVKQLIEALPEDHQEILRMRYAAGLSYEEMASVLKRSPAALKMAVHRLLEQLQHSWQTDNAGPRDSLDDHGGASHA